MRFGVILAAVGLSASVAFALPAPRPDFDPRSVVRQVRQAGRREHRRGSGSRPSSRHATRPRRPVPAPAAGVEDGEFLVDASISLMPGPYDRTLPAVAFDGTNFLVVWEDDRGLDWYYDIYGARVTPAGVVLDSAGVAICEATNDQNCPAVCFDGTNFLVVWEDWRDGNYLDIYGARVSPAGEVLDPAGIPVCVAEEDQFSAALGFDGENFLVTWEDYRSGTWEDIYGARVTPEGAVLDPPGFIISQGERDECYPAVGFDSVNFLVVWEDYRGVDGGDIYGARVTPDGIVLDTSGIAVSTAANGQYCPALGFVGGNFLVAWEDNRNGSSFDVYATRVSPQGAVLDPSGFVVSQAADDQWWVDVGSDSANFLVVWEDDRGAGIDIYGARITPAGTVLDPSGINVTPVADYEFTPAVGFGDGTFLVVMENDTVGMNIFGARVTPQGAAPDSAGLIISQAAQDQYSPAVGFDGANFLVVWEDGRSVSWYENYDIYGARVTPDGTVLDPAGFVISNSQGEQFLPAVGSNGAGFLVVWEDYRNSYYGDIYGARVTAAGAVLDPQGIAISQAVMEQRSPDVGANGENFLVVWEDQRYDRNTDIFGARVTPAGMVLDPSGIAIAPAPYYQSSPAVASDGTNSLVVWQDDRTGSGWSDIHGTRVTPVGTLLDSASIVISAALYDQLAPDVSFDGTNFLVVWEDVRNAITWDIYGARVTPQGTVLDTGIAISQSGGDEGTPVVGFDGADFVVAWEDFRTGTNWDIYGARVTSAGEVRDTWPVTTRDRDQVLLALACAPGGRMLAVYQSWTCTVNGRGYYSPRIWGRLGLYTGVGEEGQLLQAGRRQLTATIIRGTLHLPDDRGPETGDRAELMDVTGRKAMDLRPGANDVRALAPGVYFLRQTSGWGRKASSVTRVVVQR